MWDVSRQSCQSSAARARARTKTTLLLVGLLASIAEARIEGLVTAVFSPFDASGEVDTGVVPLQQAWLNATGVAWVFVTGTTGESLSLSVAERKQLTDAWIATGTNVIAHVGAESIRDARALASHAAAAGAKAVGAMPPTFFKPATAAALASTISSICAAAAPLPCYYYHIPSMTGVNIPMIDFVKAIEPLAPTFAGIKYTGMYDHPGMMGAQRVLEYKGGKYEVLSGREEMMLEALSIGIRGHVRAPPSAHRATRTALRLCPPPRASAHRAPPAAHRAPPSASRAPPAAQRALPSASRAPPAAHRAPPYRPLCLCPRPVSWDLLGGASLELLLREPL